MVCYARRTGEKFEIAKYLICFVHCSVLFTCWYIKYVICFDCNLLTLNYFRRLTREGDNDGFTLIMVVVGYWVTWKKYAKYASYIVNAAVKAYNFPC